PGWSRRGSVSTSTCATRRSTTRSASTRSPRSRRFWSAASARRRRAASTSAGSARRTRSRSTSPLPSRRSSTRRPRPTSSAPAPNTRRRPSVTAIRVVVAGVTGWTGSALAAAILKADDLALAGAVSRRAAGRDAGDALGLGKAGVTVNASLEESLAAPSDVVVDYTRPDAVKRHVLLSLEKGRHVVIGTSGLGAADYREIDAAARAAGRGVFAAGNFSITATLLKRFALEAARYVPDVEVIDYASASKPDTPSGTARELAEALGAMKRATTAKKVTELVGLRESRGAAVG